jgi:cation:H+ antiporter
VRDGSVKSCPMWLQIGLFVVGLALLLAGGEALVRGASALARRLGMSAAVIGLTVVAFGTSAPELVVSMLSAAQGTSELAFGNVLGSNVANLGLLLGLTALLLPLRVDSTILLRELPLLLLGGLAAIFLGLDSLLGSGPDVFSRADGLVLLLFFAVFLYANGRDVLRGVSTDPMLREAGESLEARPELGRAVWLTLGGLVGLGLGGHLLVDSAVVLARSAGVSEVVIGATIVAIGTSLPELVTSLAAARKGHDDLALGNLVGSNVFNLMFVLGSTASVLPVAVPPGGWVDLVVATLFVAAILPMAYSRRRISRVEGALLLCGYVGYSLWQLLR